MLLNNLAPLWDEAISAMLSEHYFEHQQPLSLENLNTLAVENATRIGDIMETLFLMSIYGDWQYSDASGEAKQLDQSALDELYSNGRPKFEDLQDFSGTWSPVT